MRIRSTTILLIAWSLTCGLTSQSADETKSDRGKREPRTIQAPEDHARIQKAIDAADNEDTALVALGVYREQLRLHGKQITLTSRFLTSRDGKDIQQTVLDGSILSGGKTTRGKTLITVAHDAGPKTRIVGFTIRNGDAIDRKSGGGVCRANIFEKNRDDAVDLDGATEVVIEDNEILSTGDDGIEIRLHKYSGKMLNIVIRRNRIIGSGEDGIQIIDYPDKSNRIIRIERNVIAKTHR